MEKVYEEALESVTAQDELEHKAYLDLVRYARWLAKMYAIRGHWLLNPDDIIGEAMYTLAKCIRKYINNVPYENFKAIARVSMRNAIGTLRYKATLTHRKVELTMPSLDELVMQDDDITLADTISGGIEPESFYDLTERMADVVSKLDAFQVKVLNAMLGGEPRVASYLSLHRDRANFVYKNPTIRVNAYVIARALMVPETEVRQALKFIKELIYGQD